MGRAFGFGQCQFCVVDCDKGVAEFLPRLPVVPTATACAYPIRTPRGGGSLLGRNTTLPNSSTTFSSRAASAYTQRRATGSATLCRGKSCSHASYDLTPWALAVVYTGLDPTVVGASYTGQPSLLAEQHQRDGHGLYDTGNTAALHGAFAESEQHHCCRNWSAGDSPGPLRAALCSDGRPSPPRAGRAIPAPTRCRTPFATAGSL